MSDTQTAAVIIPTTGRPTLRRAVESVMAQTHGETVAVVVVDGPQFGPAVIDALGDLLPNPRIQLMPLPQNTGAGGYMGHRIYAAIPLLVNQDWIFNLDDDNWFEPEHVAECVGTCVENGLSWCAAMRNIIDSDGNFVCVDECESLAVVPAWHEDRHHADASCFCMSRQIAVQLSQYWHRPQTVLNGTTPVPNADNHVCNVLMQDAPRFAFIARPTVNYSLGSRDLSPSAEFFQVGNVEIRKRFGGTLPWETTIANGTDKG